MKSLIVFLLVLGAAAPAFAVKLAIKLKDETAPCTGMNPDAQDLFALIEDPKSTAASVQTWLSNHADPSMALDSICETPIQDSLHSKREDLFNILYAKAGSPDLNVVPRLIRISKYSIYDYVLMFGSWNLIQEMRAKGGDIKKWDGYTHGMSDLTFAVQGNSADVVKNLIGEGDNVNTVPAGESADSPLASAVLNNDASVVEVLIKAGAKVNYRDSIGQSALFSAALIGNLDIMNALINSGADVAFKDIVGENALFQTVFGDDTGALDLLLKAGLSVNSRNMNEETPLFAAAGFGSNAAVSDLITRGAKINYRATSYRNLTPLMQAAENNSSDDVIETLVRAGANLEMKSSNGKTAYDFAKCKGRSEAILQILNPGR